MSCRALRLENRSSRDHVESIDLTSDNPIYQELLMLESTITESRSYGRCILLQRLSASSLGGKSNPRSRAFST